MKKLFTLLSALLCAWSIQAQTLTFHHEGQDIENGSTFYSMDYNEIIFGFGNLTFTPEIYLRGDETRTVHVRVESLDECAVWAFCAFDGSCINTLESTNYVAEKTSILIDANTGNRGDANLQLECILGKVDATQTYTRRLLVSAWYEGEENNKVSFTLVVTTDESLLSIDGVQASKAHVAMQGNVMHYALNGEGVHTLCLYGLDGSMVMSRTLADSEGQVSLSSLRKGIYLYQIVGKSGSKAQGKVIIK